MREMTRLEQIAFWIGNIEEADRQIEVLLKMKSKTAQAKLAKAMKFRNEAVSKIAELSGSK